MLPLLIGTAYLWLMPLNKQFGYSYLLESCGRSDFLYHKLFESDNIDIAFLGTSVTLCGIMDDSLEQRINHQTGKTYHLANLSYCRPGRNLRYVILKDLLAHHKPQLILIEARFREDRFSHKDFPFIAESEDLFSQNILFNQRYPESLVDALECRWDYSRHKLLDIAFEPVDSAQLRPHSYVSVKVTADPQMLQTHQEKTTEKYHRYLEEGRGIADRISYRYPRKVLGEMAALAKEADVPIVFYYLKNYGHPAPEPWEIDVYRQLGPVWIPPDSIFQKKANFSDQDHLNDQGASLLTAWFEGELTAFLESR